MAKRRNKRGWGIRKGTTPRNHSPRGTETLTCVAEQDLLCFAFRNSMVGPELHLISYELSIRKHLIAQSVYDVLEENGIDELTRQVMVLLPSSPLQGQLCALAACPTPGSQAQPPLCLGATLLPTLRAAAGAGCTVNLGSGCSVQSHEFPLAGPQPEACWA